MLNYAFVRGWSVTYAGYPPLRLLVETFFELLEAKSSANKACEYFISDTRGKLTWKTWARMEKQKKKRKD